MLVFRDIAQDDPLFNEMLPCLTGMHRKTSHFQATLPAATSAICCLLLLLLLMMHNHRCAAAALRWALML